MRRLIIGDIHGMYTKMLQALERAGYNPYEDELYSVGDLCDRGSNPIEVIDYIYSLPNCYPILGNHDLFLLEYLSGVIDSDTLNVWTRYNGGEITKREIEKQSKQWKKKTLTRLMDTPFARMAGDHLIVHGGISSRAKPWPLFSYIDITPAETGIASLGYQDYAYELTWDRESIKSAVLNRTKTPCDIGHRVFVGHTVIKDFKPLITDDGLFVDVDTGSFLNEGFVTVMDMDTLEYWQSDIAL